LRSRWPPSRRVALPDGVAFSRWLYLLGATTPAAATSYAFVAPPVARFVGVAVAHEVLVGALWIACGVLPAGVFLIFRGKTGRNPSKKNDTPE
jgi:drug/metabolite transporter (DMT)-like permease